jgi:hypothetical protein
MEYPNLAKEYPDFDQSEVPEMPEGIIDTTPNDDYAWFTGRGVSVEISPIDRSKRAMGADFPRFNVLRSPTAEEVAEHGEPGTGDFGGAEDEPIIGTESWFQALYAMTPYLYTGDEPEDFWKPDPKPDFEALAIEAYRAEKAAAGFDHEKTIAAEDAFRFRLGELRWQALYDEERINC